jgi:hypothetical protein
MQQSQFTTKALNNIRLIGIDFASNLVNFLLGRTDELPDRFSRLASCVSR